MAHRGQTPQTGHQGRRETPIDFTSENAEFGRPSLYDRLQPQKAKLNRTIWRGRCFRSRVRNPSRCVERVPQEHELFTIWQFGMSSWVVSV